MLRPRKPQLDLDPGQIPRHWFAGSAVASHISNGVSLLFPAGERFFVRSVNHYLESLADPALRAEVRGFFGQEGSHARAHEQDFERLRAQGYKIDGFLRLYQRFSFDVLEKHCPPALNLAGTAAAEHFTAIMAESALTTDGLALAHPEMRKLLLWHAAEEIEHKHVAFDVLQAVNPSYALRMAGLALATLNLAAWWMVATAMLLHQDGVTPRSARREMKAIRAHTAKMERPEEPIFSGVFTRGIREYARRDFHPRQHDNYALAAAYLAQAGLEPRAEAA
jgi:predicted metal-dependent hydrolase